MDERGIEDHPDLTDRGWQRRAEKQASIELRRTRRRARRGRRLALPTAGVLAALAAIIAVSQWGTPEPDHEDTTAPASTSAPTVLPELSRVDLSRPFDNTPAQAWAGTVDGLSVPPAAKIGSFSAAQVQDAYNKVKQLISVAHLDRRTLEGHDTSAYLSLLAVSEQSHIRPILADRGKPDFAAYVTFVADGFHLLPTGPRITGRLSAHPGDPGELVVHAEYVVGFAFDPGSHRPLTSAGDIDAFERHQEDFSILTNPPYDESDAGLEVGGGSSESYSMACGPAKAGYLAPVYSDETLDGGDQPVDEAAIFDVNKPMPTSDNC